MLTPWTARVCSRIAETTPMSSKTSIVRVWTTAAFDQITGASSSSTTRTERPCRISSHAMVKPVGPAPTTSTSGLTVDMDREDTRDALSVHPREQLHVAGVLWSTHGRRAPAPRPAGHRHAEDRGRRGAHQEEAALVRSRMSPADVERTEE